MNEVIETAIDDNTFRADDLEFTFAARVSSHVVMTSQILMAQQDWSDRVDLGNMDGYREKFEKVQQYFAPRFPEATALGNEMIRTILEHVEKTSEVAE